MLQVRRILVPCDFSDSSREALARAGTLAGWYGARLTVLHVVPLWPSTTAFPPYVNPVSLDAATRDRLLAELKTFAQPPDAAGAPLSLAVHEGDPADEIVREAEASAADLVVMGTHGQRGFERWAIGSVTERVLRTAACPVLTLRLGSDSALASGRAPFERILCAIDFCEPSFQGLEYALALAQESHAGITLLHVLERMPLEEPSVRGGFSVEEYRRSVEQAARDRLRQLVPDGAREWCDPDVKVVTGSAHEQIVAAATESATQLIVLGVHGHGVLNRMLFGSTTRRVVRDAPCPILSVRSAARLKRSAVSAQERRAGGRRPAIAAATRRGR